jgi:amino acid transporter
MACAALSIDLVVIGLAFWSSNSELWSTIRDHVSAGREISSYELLVGFAAAWLAFSGLESISQLSPTMRFPLRRTTRWAMAAVVITMVVTAPVLTALSVGVLPEQVKETESERFISELGYVVGGWSVKLAVVLTASSLLLFASNTAIIGSYHVFLALARQGFHPKILELRNRAFNTPHIAILIATCVPALLITMTRGQMMILGDMYAFGLLGAFVFSSLSLDTIRWNLGRRDIGFWIGALTTGMVVLAWAINLREKQLATYFGCTVTLIGMITAIGVRRAWFVDLLVRFPFIQRLQARA